MWDVRNEFIWKRDHILALHTVLYINPYTDLQQHTQAAIYLLTPDLYIQLTGAATSALCCSSTRAAFSLPSAAATCSKVLPSCISFT